MEIPDILQERKLWYSRLDVLFEIVKCLKDRELCFIERTNEGKSGHTVRYLKAHAIDYLKKHFQWMNSDTKLINLYHSIATLKSMPMFGYNLITRKKEINYIEFNEKFSEYVTGINFFFDIDGKENPQQAYKDTKELKQLLDEHKVPYYLLNSSLTGFHIHIPSIYLPNLLPSDLISSMIDVTKNIKGIYEFPCIDETITDIKRVCKVPYSYVCDGSICLPLTDEQFDTYTQKTVSIESVLKLKIRDRGLLVRTHGLSESQLKENIEKFIREFI